MINKFQKFFTTHQLEIFDSKVLRCYGIFLSLYLGVGLFFMSRSAVNELQEMAFPVSWPNFPSWLEIRSANFWYAYLVVCGLIWAISIFCFVLNFKTGYWALLTLFFMKTFLGLQDYSFMGNYHYMPAVIIGLYLFSPIKKLMIPVFIVLFYFFAGLLKLNVEWLSGKALLSPVPQFLQTFGTWNFIFVIYLELVISWLLLMPFRKLRNLALVLLILFHLISWHWVGYFYPITMLCLLSYFLLTWTLEPEHEILKNTRSLSHYPMLIIIIFCISQVVQKIQPTDSTLTGDGRIIGLNMYDAQSECFQFGVVRAGTDQWEISNGVSRESLRVRCDPILYIDQMKRICDEFNINNQKGEVSYYQIAKRKSESTFTQTVAIENFCSNPVRFSLFGWNKWINNK